MTSFAHISEDWAWQRLNIYLGYKYSGRREFLNPVDGVMRSVNREETETAEDIPKISLPEDIGRALLDELSRYFHGAEDTRALRKDYDAERARVDLFIERVTKR